jgi:hypothetical protein
MGKIIQLPMRSIKKATIEQLKYEWDKWDEIDAEIDKTLITFGALCAFVGIILWYILCSIWELSKPLLHSLTA